MASPLPTIKTRRITRNQKGEEIPPSAEVPVVAPVPPAAPAVNPNVPRCPFSGEPLSFRVVGETKSVLVTSPFGWTSKLFPTMDQAKEWASFLGGKQGWFRPKIETRVIEPPLDDGDVTAGLVPDQVDDDDLPPSIRGM